MSKTIVLSQEHLVILLETFRIGLLRDFIFNDVAEELELSDEAIQEVADLVEEILAEPNPDVVLGLQK